MKEETKDINGFKITLPVGWKFDPKANRDDYASYITEERGWREIMHHLHALTTVLAPNLKALRYKLPLRVLHAFGGLGATAQVIQQVEPESTHTFWERSKECCEYLMDKKWDNVLHVEDSMKVLEQTDLKMYDVIIFDPSLGTILSPGIVRAWDVMAVVDTPLIWVSDFATSKLHLNYRAYAKVFGVETPNAEMYAQGYDHFLRQRGKRIIDAIRDSFEMYFVIVPDKVKNGKKQTFPRPIPKMA